MVKSLLGLFSPAGDNARLSILIFHRIFPQSDPMFPMETDAFQFEEICKWLKAWCNVLPLDEAVARLASDSLPARALAITFDDGYLDNFTVALPILQRYDMTATFFVAVGFLDGGRMWNDTVIEAVRNCDLVALDFAEEDSGSGLGLGRLAIGSWEQKRVAVAKIIDHIKYLPTGERDICARRVAYLARVEHLPDDLMMRSVDVRELHRMGMQIGAHTLSHPILGGLDRTSAVDEIAGSKMYLEQLLGEKINLFAYPNGKPGTDYNRGTVEIVRELGFEAAVSTAGGAASGRTDRHQLPRYTPWKKTKMGFGFRLVDNLRREGACL
ncbi:polysaccharide deacetylase family protein [Accumulibacter sp.]|uniref:polysaccharide deacetylase family protein n=1 Tax=Accumulibacter sp. TaxID=2053492 RepID=UPI0028C38BE8|nr:polysaccharide deacetylase family protein [Accumulibacter sp.]